MLTSRRIRSGLTAIVQLVYINVQRGGQGIKVRDETKSKAVQEAVCGEGQAADR